MTFNPRRPFNFYWNNNYLNLWIYHRSLLVSIISDTVSKASVITSNLITWCGAICEGTECERGTLVLNSWLSLKSEGQGVVIILTNPCTLGISGS